MSLWILSFPSIIKWVCVNVTLQLLPFSPQYALKSLLVPDSAEPSPAKAVGDSVAIEEWEKPRDKNGITLSLKDSIQIVPAGPLFFHSLSRSDFYAYSMNGTGMCKGSDASVFEKALNQSN